MLCYTLTVRDLSRTRDAAHIHVGTATRRRPDRHPPDRRVGHDLRDLRLRHAGRRALAALQANPKAYYVNVHTSAFPGGEVRGQLK